MPKFRLPPLSRRAFLASSAAAAAGAMMPLHSPSPAQAAPLREVTLRAAPGRVRLLPAAHAKTQAWSYNGGMMGNMGTMHKGGIWFINGVAAEGHVMEPMLTLERDRAHVIP